MTRPYKQLFQRRRPVPGDTVYHKKHGVGRVRGNWGTIVTNRGRESAYCEDIIDVIFTTQYGGNYLHCCRKEYLIIL